MINANFFFSKILYILIAMRVSHYVKNIIVFFPVFFITFNLEYSIQLLYTFFAFCFISSAGYLFNDCMDIKADRENYLKKSRPLASKKLTLFVYKLLGVHLVFFSLVFSLLVSTAIFIHILIYMSLSLLYSLILKKIVFIDVISLTLFYVLRLTGGISSQENPITAWPLFYGFIFFLTLSIIKRLVDQNNYKKNSIRILYNKSSIKILTFSIRILILFLPILSLIYLFNYNLIFSSVQNGVLLIIFVSLWNIYIASKAIEKKIKKDIILFVLTDSVSVSIFLIIIIILINNIFTLY